MNQLLAFAVESFQNWRYGITQLFSLLGKRYGYKDLAYLKESAPAQLRVTRPDQPDHKQPLFLSLDGKILTESPIHQHIPNQVSIKNYK